MQYWEYIQDFIKEVIDEGQVSNREISFDSPDGSRTLMMSAILVARNFIEAMPEGGRLTIGTYEDAKTVNLVIAGEGQGIPPEIAEMIGTPFLTTKKNGSGLGMAVCYSIAERYDARITFETSPKGTSFKVSFPVVA